MVILDTPEWCQILDFRPRGQALSGLVMIGFKTRVALKLSDRSEATLGYQMVRNGLELYGPQLHDPGPRVADQLLQRFPILERSRHA